MARRAYLGGAARVGGGCEGVLDGVVVERAGVVVGVGVGVGVWIEYTVVHFEPPAAPAGCFNYKRCFTGTTCGILRAFGDRRRGLITPVVLCSPLCKTQPKTTIPRSERAGQS